MALTLRTYDNFQVTPQEYGAVGDGVADDTAAISSWFSGLLATGAEGYLPAGTYKVTSQVYWNLTSVARTGIKIGGAGKQQAILDLSSVTASPALLIGGTANLFYSKFCDFGVKGNVAGILLQLGHEDYSDPMNVFEIDLWVSNANTSATAVGVELNYFLNSPLACFVVNNAGHGDALRLRQAAFNHFLGSFGNADIDLHITAGFNYGNVFDAVDMETVGVCVQFDSASAVNNVWLGGTFVWTGAAAIVANNASNYNRFIVPNFGVAGTILTGALAPTVLIEDRFLGVSPFGGILVSPPTGDGDVSIDSVAGNSAFLVAKRAGSTRWQIGRDNSTEGGGNVGSSFLIQRFTDLGVAIDNPISIARATGVVTLLDGLAMATGSTCGLFGAALTAQPSNGGSSVQNNVGTTNATFQDTGFTGGVGTRAYTIGQLVAALKTLGAIAS